ncbi:hypothetical protein PI124_g15484 [Phytophthora idaei]|nr:hypothetical protein PI125_g16924 [Phytophthora idaei]KAG3239586.1 hypothetical protein PI124_g15484 [Phytophthora idaei]
MGIILATNFATLEDITKEDADMEGLEEEEAAAIREPTSGGDNTKLNTKPSDELDDTADVDVVTCVNAKYDVEPDEKPDENQADKAPDVDDDKTSTNAKFRVGSRGIDEDGDSGKGGAEATQSTWKMMNRMASVVYANVLP